MPIMIKTPGGEDIVILSYAEYNDLEDRAEINIVRRSKRDVASGKTELLTSVEAKKYCEAQSTLAFWREKRGLTIEALSSLSQVERGFISKMEADIEVANVRSLRRIADALYVTIDDIV